MTVCNIYEWLTTTLQNEKQCLEEVLTSCLILIPGLLAAFSWWFAHPYLALGGIQLGTPPGPAIVFMYLPKGAKFKNKKVP